MPPAIHAHNTLFWRMTLAVTLGSILVFANVYVTQPLLPMISRQFGVSSISASYSFTLPTLMLGLSLLCYGPLSDALGRRTIMLTALSGAVICTLLLSWVDHFAGLLLLRAVQGILLGGLPALALAYLGDELDRTTLATAVGIYISGNSLGGISSRVLGGWAGEHLGLNHTFLLLAGCSFMLLIGFIWLLPHSRRFSAQPLHPHRIARNFISHLRHPHLRLSYAIGGLNFFVFVNQYSVVTYRLAVPPYSLSEQWLGLLFLTYLAGTFSAALSGRIAKYLGAPLTMMLGIVMMIGGTLITMAAPLPWIISGFTVSAFGFFLCHANASGWVSRKATHARASASALYLVCYYLGASTGGIFLALCWHHFQWPGVVVGSLLVYSLTLFMTFRLYQLQHSETEMIQQQQTR